MEVARKSCEPGTGTVEITLDSACRMFCLEVGEADRHDCLAVPDGSEVRIGSSRSNDIVLLDRTVSSQHCVVGCRGGRLFVEDLRSRNGVFVGGARVQAALLTPGSCFVVGRVAIVVRAGPAPELKECEPLPGVVGRSPAMMRVVSQVRRFAPLSIPVLVRGPTGTGKELIARALHALGSRASGPFHAMNAGSLPRELADAELFGHDRGAFTGAHVKREGAFVLANGGTLFLDEIGELPHDIQVKLLRVLEERAVRALGSPKAVPVDVRVVAATCAPLEQMIEEGRFRLDMYHRLAVGLITLPPLSDRRSDIPALVSHVLAMRADDCGQKKVSSAALACLTAQRWPGNIRQLNNVVVRAAVLSSGETIGPGDVEAAMHEHPHIAPRLTRSAAAALVRSYGGKIATAAKSCGVPRSTFRGWLRGESDAQEEDRGDEPIRTRRPR